jgi:hypothetical protein
MKHFAPFVIAIISFFIACNDHPGDKAPVNIPSNIEKDSLPDSARFVFNIDDTKYSVAAAAIDVHYSASDSGLSIDAGTKDGERLNIIIADIKHTPGFRGNAWRSNNTRLAGSDSLVYQPTVSFYRNKNGTASWNNFNDGRSGATPQNNNSLYIYGIRKTGERNFLIKGRINTRLLKNVYESADKEFNKDHKVAGEFVIMFEDYWLKL